MTVKGLNPIPAVNYYLLTAIYGLCSVSPVHIIAFVTNSLTFEKSYFKLMGMVHFLGTILSVTEEETVFTCWMAETTENDQSALRQVYGVSDAEQIKLCQGFFLVHRLN